MSLRELDFGNAGRRASSNPPLFAELAQNQAGPSSQLRLQLEAGGNYVLTELRPVVLVGSVYFLHEAMDAQAF
jgi:hypothetical protein